MQPFPEEDVFEIRKIHPGVDDRVLWDLFIGVEFGLPLGVVERGDGARNRLPTGYRKTRFC
ncbi:hypothetical protein D3C87_1930730 [compost metagenome]